MAKHMKVTFQTCDEETVAGYEYYVIDQHFMTFTFLEPEHKTNGYVRTYSIALHRISSFEEWIAHD